jgi:hypothetical protein
LRLPNDCEKGKQEGEDCPVHVLYTLYFLLELEEDMWLRHEDRGQ